MRKYKDYENKKANLMLFVDRAKQFESSSFKGLFNFINFIFKIKETKQDLGSASIIGEADNVVRLMSIHKSKGLEFPICYFAGFSGGMRRSIFCQDDHGNWRYGWHLLCIWRCSGSVYQEPCRNRRGRCFH